MKYLRLIVRTLLWAALAAVVFLLSCQKRLMYFPRPYDKGSLWDISKRDGRRIEVQTSQGSQTAFYLPSKARGAQQPPEFLWLIFGGNGSLSLDYSGEPIHWDARFGYLFIDYPGYGLCQGSPSPAHIEESTIKLVQKLQSEFHWSDEELRTRTGVFGHSLGCAAGLIAADHFQLRRAVLCAPFTTMTEMARIAVGWPLCYVNLSRFDNVAHLAPLSARGFQARIFHATADSAIPVSMSRRLAAQFPKNVRLTEVENSDHNMIVMDATRDIGSAMQELVAGPP